MMPIRKSLTSCGRPRKFRKGLKEPFVLDLSGFSIINIPNLDRVGSCQVMNFSKNALKTLEEGLMWDMRHNIAWHNKLRELDLSSNALKKFPHVLTRLVTLVKIDVSDNNIVELPAEICFLTRLITLTAEGNPLSSPTMTVVRDGVETYMIRGSEEHSVAMGIFECFAIHSITDVFSQQVKQHQKMIH